MDHFRDSLRKIFSKEIASGYVQFIVYLKRNSTVF